MIPDRKIEAVNKLKCGNPYIFSTESAACQNVLHRNLPIQVLTSPKSEKRLI